MGRYQVILQRVAGGAALTLFPTSMAGQPARRAWNCTGRGAGCRSERSQLHGASRQITGLLRQFAVTSPRWVGSPFVIARYRKSICVTGPITRFMAALETDADFAPFDLPQAQPFLS